MIMLKQLCRNIYQHTKKCYFSTNKMGKLKMVLYYILICVHTSSQTNSFKNDTEVERIVWMDLEMSGLNVDQDRIMEIAVLVTDANLNIVAEGPELVIHQPPEILNNMNEWCVKQHGKTGLTEASRSSKITVQDAEHTVLNFCKQYLQPGMSPLAGNSVYYDRMFIKKYMPKLDEFMHYRTIDVSSIKELCRRWNPEVYKKAPKKEYHHRSLSDIKESVEELKYYKNHFLKTV